VDPVKGKLDGKLTVVRQQKTGRFIIKAGRRTVRLRYQGSFARKEDAQIVAYWLGKGR
jgi:hypothetical protein